MLHYKTRLITSTNEQQGYGLIHVYLYTEGINDVLRHSRVSILHSTTRLKVIESKGELGLPKFHINYLLRHSRLFIQQDGW